MYERSAVILERYFAEKFYYKDENNLKNNYKNYCVFIENLEEYQEVSEAEDQIINECEDIANQIKQVQRSQSSLYRRNLKLQEDRNVLFENIDESAEELSKQLAKIEKELDKNNERMRPVDQEFVDTIAKFNEKSDVRLGCAKKRRKTEKEYRTILEELTNSVNDIDLEKITEIKHFINSDDDTLLNEDLKKIMVKNGENEKVPFDSNVIENAIIFGKNIHKQEIMLLLDVYNRTKTLLDDVNGNGVKIKKYKKLAKDVKNRLAFIAVQKEYLVQFLDNERLSVNLGKQEHKKLMKEACNDFKKDIEQINNLNEILLAEIAGKATQKMYQELYSAEYLKDLQEEEQEFENKLSELNMVGKILNPIYWRIESIEKLYVTFDDIVTKEYERDLSKFKIEEIEEEPEEELEESDDNFLEDEEYLINEEPEEMIDDFEEDDDYFNDDDYDEEDYDEEDDYDDDDYFDEGDYDEDDYTDESDYDDEKLEQEDEFEEQEDEQEYGEIDFYNDDVFNNDDNDDFYNDSNYDDIEMILRNRKKGNGRGRNRKSEETKKKGLFGKLRGKN